MPAFLRRALAGYPELAAVVAAAAVGLTVQAPLRWLDARHGIDVMLAILVFATALNTDPAGLRHLRSSSRAILAALAAGTVVLPGLSWVAARLVAAGALRNGVMTAGLAPCEIASVATTAMAAGEPAVAAGILVGSTVCTVALAGPILELEASGARIDAVGIAANLGIVVALPLAAGLVFRSQWQITERASSLVAAIATVAVATLVGLIGAEVHLSSRYLPVIAALLVFVVISAGIGSLLGRRTPHSVAVALTLTTSMRDFAIAAGLAATAFGPAAAAPLGVYGIMVLIWGTAAAGRLRGRGEIASPESAAG